MEIDKDEPLRIYDDKGYYQFEKIGGISGEIIVRAAYYAAQDKFDPVKTAAVPNRVFPGKNSNIFTVNWKRTHLSCAGAPMSHFSSHQTELMQ